jgi:hypothetical protein
MAEIAEEKLKMLVGQIRRVRQWLLALAILKVVALSMIFVIVYTGVYAWLDHWINFGVLARTIAFVLLIAGFAFLLHTLARSLVVHISYSGAANFIENKRSFNQQLVTAVEYYENRQDYPYSRALAEQLVLQVCEKSEGFRFDSTVQKWQGCVLAGIILFGMCIAGLYVRVNYRYFSSYFARLIRPLAAIEPLVPTGLRPITEDIVARPDSEVTFAAEIQGRAPESGKLVLVSAEPNAPDTVTDQSQQETTVYPTSGQGQIQRFEASKSFAQPGQFKYRFQTESARTPWHQLRIHPAPQIESMTADVLLPPRPPRRDWAQPYTEEIKDQTLEVIARSTVTLNVQVTEPLREVTITGPDGQPLTKHLNGDDRFTFSFSAEKSGTVKFSLIDEQGLATDDVPDLQLTVRNDEPPKLKLISPEGDYLTTNVASVPITFEVTDDFGLDTVQMCLEIPRQKPKELAIPVTQGQKSHTFTQTLELEQYDLLVGDSILFYAKASDIDTGSTLASRTASSDVYFIEIRPYRQDWRPKPGGDGQGKGGGSPPEELLNILEYTRAILKKTWALADKATLTDAERGRLEAIDDDVQYCAAQLAAIRDDSEYGFNENHKAVLNQVLQRYNQASQCLAKHDASAAVPSEKEAYRILRQFILELELEWTPPSSGQGQSPEKPDTVKLQESPEFSDYEKERLEGELQRLRQKLQSLTREQKLLKTTFENFLEQQAQQKKTARDAQNEGSPAADQSKQGTDKPTAKQEKDAGTDQKAEGTQATGTASDSQSAGPSSSGAAAQSTSGSKSQSSKQESVPSDAQDRPAGEVGSDKQKTSDRRTGQKDSSPSEGDSTSDAQKASPDGRPAASPGQNAQSAKSEGEGQGPGQSQSAKEPSLAGVEAQLKMMEAKQRALQEKVSQFKSDLQQLPLDSEQPKAQARQEAQGHLDDALAKMDEFQNRITETRYQADVTGGKAKEAVELMDSARQDLHQAGKALEQGLTMTAEQQLAEKVQELAEQLAEDADALDESLDPIERQEMLARLEAAKRLLESMAQPQWSTVSKSSQGSSAVHVFTKDRQMGPGELARAVAREFWSIAINAKKRKAPLVDDEPSDVKFYELENEFFENAAKFGQKPVRK